MKKLTFILLLLPSLIFAQKGQIRSVDSTFTLKTFITAGPEATMRWTDNIWIWTDTTEFTQALRLGELGTVPGTPASGFGRLYVKSSDSDLYFKNDGGTETSLTGAAAGGAQWTDFGTFLKPSDAGDVAIHITDTAENDSIIVAIDGSGNVTFTTTTGNIIWTTGNTGNDAFQLPASSVSSTEILNSTILEVDLNVVNAAVDEDIFTFESTTGDFEWHTPSELGLVTKVGTPVNDEVGVWTGDGTLEGDTNLQWSGTALTIRTTSNGASEILNLTVEPSTPATGDEPQIAFRMTPTGGSATTFAHLDAALIGLTLGAETTFLGFDVWDSDGAGVMIEGLNLVGQTGQDYLVVNVDLVDFDFRVHGDTNTDILIVDAGTEITNIRELTLTTNLAIAQTALVAGTNISLSTNTLNVDDAFLLNTGDVGTGAYDFSGASDFEIPNAAAPTTDAFGEIAGDNNAWAGSRGAIQFFDGTANTFVVAALSSDVPTDGQVPKWQTGGTILWENDDDSGGATAWDAIANPSGDGDVGMAELDQDLSWNTAATAAAFDGLTINLTNDATSDAARQVALLVNRPASSGTATVEALVEINNEDTDGAVTAAIEVVSAAGVITTALLVSDSDIVNWADIGANDLITSTATITSAEIDRLDGLAGIIVTDVTSVTNVDGNSLTISAGTLDVDAASLTVVGAIEIATGTETNTGTDPARAVSPDGLDDWTGSAQLTSLGTIASGVWNGTAVTYANLNFSNNIVAGDLADNSVDSGELIDGSIDESHLNVTNAGTDNFVLTFNSAGGNFTWAADATGSGAWTDTDPVLLATSTRNVEIGDTGIVLDSKVQIAGDTDEVQLIIEGHSTQTDDIFIIQQDDESQVFTVSNTGVVTMATDLAITEGGTGASALDDIVGTTDEIAVANGANTIIGGDVTLTLPNVFEEVMIPAGYFNPGAGDLTGATALADDAELEFSASAENYVSALIKMPPDWDGSTAPTFRVFYYTETGSANDVDWTINTGYIRPGTDSWVAALGTADSILHSPTTTDIIYDSGLIDPTPAGTAAANAFIKIRLWRDGNDANDDHAATARFLYLVMGYLKTTYGDETAF